eukprot:sb/3471852/
MTNFWVKKQIIPRLRFEALLREINIRSRLTPIHTEHNLQLSDDQSYGGLPPLPSRTRRLLHDDSRKKVSGDYSYKSHRRQGSNSSVTSADLILETSTATTTPASNARRGSGKRDLEGILGRDDHQLVLKIIEENKELISSSTTSSLTAQRGSRLPLKTFNRDEQLFKYSGYNEVCY